MKMTIQFPDTSTTYSFDGLGHDISIPLHFNGPQPNTYGVPKAQSQPYEGQGFIGDVRQGSGCNFESYQFIAHCNGTHTECIGHITSERISQNDCLSQHLFPATLITISPELGSLSTENYQPPLENQDLLISQKSLEQALEHSNHDFLQALIIRTLPNLSQKKSRDYIQELPAFFTHEAMQYIRDLGVNHLLVDIP